MLTAGLQQRLQQRQKLAQQIQLSLRLLPLSNHQLQRYLEQQLRHNPALGWRPGSLPNAASGQASAHDIALATHVGNPSLSEYLLGQLYQLDADDELKLLAEIIIDALTEDGYLPLPLAALRAQHLELQELSALPLRSWQQALTLVQSLEPAGVAASDLSECLRLQLLQEPDSSQRQLAMQLISADLQLLASTELSALAARHACELTTMQQAVQLIRSLEPKPGRAFAAAPALVQADAEILLQDNQLQVKLLQPASETIALQHSAHASAAQRQQARQLLQALQLREQNLYQIITAAVQQQTDMLLQQDQTLAKPLAQAELAAQLGLHPSTISRAVRTRHVLWRGQLLSLRQLFSRGMRNADGANVATTAIKAALQQIVAAEPAEQPHSDLQLQQQLAAHGYDIARRTVAKYRQQLDIPASHLRHRNKNHSNKT